MVLSIVPMDLQRQQLRAPIGGAGDVAAAELFMRRAPAAAATPVFPNVTHAVGQRQGYMHAAGLAPTGLLA